MNEMFCFQDQSSYSPDWTKIQRIDEDDLELAPDPLPSSLQVLG